MLKSNLLSKLKIYSLMFVSFFLANCAGKTVVVEQTKTEKSAYELVQRLLPEKASKFVFDEIQSKSGNDFFEIESLGDKIQLSGNNAGAMASGLNWYLKNYCNAQISLNYHQLNLPEVLPKIPHKITVETPFEYRYIFNYCTYGYSMPWWNWERWEEVIDYMALQGVNLPLATIGQEAVWQEVYKELGLSDQQLDDFFVGPAHLPWGRMGNIDGMGGPLPQLWITQRAELQKKILKRMRALGMKPVLQGFTGHVPKALKELYPESKIVQIDNWAGIPGTMFLDPTDSLFQTISKLFIQKQSEMYGTDHFYDADCFIEVNPPSSDPEFLKGVSKAVYQSMASADPEATWVIQGWFFFFKKDFWKLEQGRAFFNGIPKNKALVLDLYGEKNTTWDKTEAFFGQPWVWNVICNEDQKVNMSGDLKTMQTNFQNAFKTEGKNNLKGIGVIPEGIGFNPVIQEFIFEKAWDTDSVDVVKWVETYAQRRYNTSNVKVDEAWKGLLNTVYGRTRTMWSPLITTPRLMEIDKTTEDIRHVRKEFEVTAENPFAWDFNVYEFHKAISLLLEVAPELQNNNAYRFDLTHAYREFLHAFSHRFIHDLSEAYHNNNLAELEKAGNQLIKLLEDLEAVTGANEQFLLGNWLEDAKSWGETRDEKKYYEWNARTIITIWQPWKNGGLRDYAGKTWNGMFSGYYQPRWELLISFLKQSLESNKAFDPRAYDKAVREMDFNWTHSNEIYPTQASGDIVEIAKRIEKEYSRYLK